MLTNLVKKRLDIPGEPGEWVDVRMLSGKALDRAREVKLQAIFEMAKAMGEQLRTSIAEQRADAEPTEDDPMAAYDVETVLRCGLVAWSYGAKLTPESIDQLDESTRAWAAKEIVALTVETEASRLGN